MLFVCGKIFTGGEDESRREYAGDELNGNLESVIAAFGEIGIDDAIVIYGCVTLEKKSANRCNLHINCGVDSVPGESTPGNAAIDMSKVRTLLGLNTLYYPGLYTIDATPYQASDLDSQITSSMAGYGFSGSFYTSEYLCLGRRYNTSGDVGPYAITSRYYTPGTIWRIDLYNLTYSLAS